MAKLDSAVVLAAFAVTTALWAQGGDTPGDATEIPSLPFVDTGTTSGFNDDADEACPWESTSPDVFYKYTPAEDEFIDIGLCESSYDTKLYVYDDTMTSIACSDDACSDSGGNAFRSRLDLVELQAGVTYLIVIDGWGGDAGDYLLQVERSEIQCTDDPPFFGTEWALSFDGDNDQVVVPDSPGLQFGADEPITIEAWVRPFSIESLRNVLSKSSDPTANYAVRVEGDRSVAMYYRNASDTGWFEYSTPGDVVRIGAWNHIAVTHTFGAGDIAVYVNGVDVGGSWSAVPTEGPMVTTQELLIGATVPPGRVLQGYLDEVRLWRAVRSQEEIVATMNTPLEGNEPGLEAYWQLEEGKGGTAGDLAGGHDGDIDGAAWQPLAECTDSCEGDTNGDGIVDFDDILAVLGAWGECPDPCPGDLDDNGVVDFEDLLLVLSSWGPCPAPSSACCIDDGCIEMTGDECVAMGGVYNPGNSCGDGVCNSSAGWIVDAPFIWPGDTCAGTDDCELEEAVDERWVVTIPAAGDWTFSVCGAAFDTVLYIGSAPCTDDIGFDDDACGVASEVTVTLEPGAYYVTLEGFSKECGSFTLVVSQ